MSTRSRTRRLAVTVVVAAMAMLVGVGIAAAQLAFDYSPDRGPPGTIVQVSVSGCIEDGVPYEYVTIRLSRHTINTGKEDYKASESHPLEPDGSWSGPFTVPGDAPYADYTISATCYEQDMVYFVGEGPFVVTDPDATPSVEPTPSVTPSSPDPTPSPTPTTPAPEPEPEPTPSVGPASPDSSPTRARPSASRPPSTDPPASEPAAVLPSETADPAATDATGRSSNTVGVVAGALTLLAVTAAAGMFTWHRGGRRPHA